MSKPRMWWSIKVPAGHVWFFGGWCRWMPVIVVWHVRESWSFEMRSQYLKVRANAS